MQYVSPQGLVRERFLGFSQLEAFAPFTSDTMQQQLAKHGVRHIACFAQSYDGASVICGVVRGVQARLREKRLEALCYAHELNLVLCSTWKAISELRNCFYLLERLYSFFSTSLVHHQNLQEFQKQPGAGDRQPVQPSCCVCQIISVNATLQNLTALIHTVGSISTPLSLPSFPYACQLTMLIRIQY